MHQGNASDWGHIMKLNILDLAVWLVPKFQCVSVGGLLQIMSIPRTAKRTCLGPNIKHCFWSNSPSDSLFAVINKSHLLH